MKCKFTYVGIRVTNLERSIEFYKTVDLQTEEGGSTLELNHYEKDSPFNEKYVVGEGLDHLAFKVDDLDNALGEAKNAGHRTIL